MDFLARLHEQARSAPRRIVLPEGNEPRTLQAAARAAQLGLARVTLLGPVAELQALARQTGTDLSQVQVQAVPAPVISA